MDSAGTKHAPTSEHPATALPWKHAEDRFQDGLRSFPQVTMLNPFPPAPPEGGAPPGLRPSPLTALGSRVKPPRGCAVHAPGGSHGNLEGRLIRERGVDGLGWPVFPQGPNSPGIGTPTSCLEEAAAWHRDGHRHQSRRRPAQFRWFGDPTLPRASEEQDDKQALVF